MYTPCTQITTEIVEIVNKNMSYRKGISKQLRALGRTGQIIAESVCVACTTVFMLCWHKITHKRCFFVDCQSSVTCVLDKHGHHLIFLWLGVWERRRLVVMDTDSVNFMQAILHPLVALLLQECWSVRKWSELDSAVHCMGKKTPGVTSQGSSLTTHHYHNNETLNTSHPEVLLALVMYLRIVVTISINAYADSDIGINSDPSPVLEEVNLSC